MLIEATSSDTKSESEFKQNAEKLVSILAKEGILSLPYENPALPLFSSLTSDQKIKAISLLKFYISSLESVLDAGEALSNNSVSLWAALKKINYKPSLDFFSHLEADDCIELYDTNHIQIWRNLNMMQAMSHSIEQIFSVPWPERYERDPEALNACISVIGELLQTPKAITKSVFVKNFVSEKGSSDLLNLDVIHRCAASVTNEMHVVSGYIIVSKVKVVGSVNASRNKKPKQPLRLVDLS